MAMIKCAECGKEFSDRANACPNCGCPIEYQAEKNIGGEYHAADKLAPSVIVEHLTIAKELESERYTLLCTIDKLQAKINRLGVIRAISKPNYNVRRKTWIAFIIASIFSICLIIYSHVTATSFEADTTTLACIISILVIITAPIITCLAVKSKEKRKYRNKMLREQSRIAKERLEIERLRQQQSYLHSKVNQISNTLESVYSVNIIHPKYRNMIAVIRLLEYFDSGLCTALTGAYGAYNKYEDEIRQDAIISKLDVAINCLYQIKDNQYMLYETLEDCLDTSDRIASQVSTLTDSNKNIEACSAIAAYNSKIAASNSDALVFIEAYKGANGL